MSKNVDSANVSKWGVYAKLARIGLIGFGGGSALIPVIKQEVVDKSKLVTESEYDSYVTIAAVTPGALPVEIAGCIGERFAGLRGMMAAACAMALPGVILSLAALVLFTYMSDELFAQVEFISVGVTAFILSMLTGYVADSFAWAKRKKRLRIALLITLGVLVLNMGKSLAKVLGLVGIDWTPILSVPTVDILLMVFFVLLFTRCEFTPLRMAPCVVLCALYVLCVCKASPIDSDILLRALQMLMACMAVFGVMRDKKPGGAEPLHWQNLARTELVWLVFLAVLSIPAFALYGDTLEYLLRGFLSSIISFGGGDAYLTIADSLFVSDAGGANVIDTATFYGMVVAVVNVMPGSILCKTLSCVGFCIGLEATDSVAIGLTVALCGFATSIVGSCSVVSLVQFFFTHFEGMKEFVMLKRWVKTIISGLLGAVMLALVYAALSLAGTYGYSLFIGAVELGVLYVLNVVLMKCTRLGTGWRVLISAILSLAVGNYLV